MNILQVCVDHKLMSESEAKTIRWALEHLVEQWAEDAEDNVLSDEAYEVFAKAEELVEEFYDE